MFMQSELPLIGFSFCCCCIADELETYLHDFNLIIIVRSGGTSIMKLEYVEWQ